MARHVEVGAPADQVVLAETTEDEVVAVATLDVVVAVGARAADVRDGRARARPGAHVDGDRAVALDRVVPLLAEDQVVANAAGDVVAAPTPAAAEAPTSKSVIARSRTKPWRGSTVGVAAMFGTNVIEPSPLTTVRYRSGPAS